MRGIEKSKFIDAIRKANIDIVLDTDVEDLFCDLGEECVYNKNGEPEFVNQDKSVNEEIQKEIAGLHFTKRDILLAKKDYEEWLDKVEELGHPPVEPIIRKNN